VLEALSGFSGIIGNYADCFIQLAGDRHVQSPRREPIPLSAGVVGSRESVQENRVEVLIRKDDLAAALNALFKAHPYEEPPSTFTRSSTAGR